MPVPAPPQPGPLRVIATGGTFDKVYDPLTGQLGFKETCVRELLEHARVDPLPIVEVVLLKDSLEMTADDRAALVACCARAPETRLVVVHGTDTMVDSARDLAQASLAKTVVLTGAMVPARIAASDAPFNLGTALAAAQLLAPGVWIAVNGMIYAWDQVQKNRQQGRFEPLPNKV